MMATYVVRASERYGQSPPIPGDIPWGQRFPSGGALGTGAIRLRAHTAGRYRCCIVCWNLMVCSRVRYICAVWAHLIIPVVVKNTVSYGKNQNSYLLMV